jgi:AsmA family protein
VSRAAGRPVRRHKSAESPARRPRPAKHFNIGALPAPISITGSFKDPGALPDITKLAVRGGVAAGLGVLFPPAAILPTIQFGVGDDHRCEALAHRGK